MKRLLLIILMLTAVSAPGQQKKPITFDDLIAVQRLSDPQVSPGGKTVAFVATSFNTAENTSNSNIFLVSIDGGTVVQLTRAQRQNANPKWMPDGSAILFVSTRDGEAQVWNIPVKGGEARKVSSISTEVSGLIVAPTGKHAVFASEVYPECADDDCNKKRNVEAAKSKVRAKVFTTLPYRIWNTWKDGKRNHVFVMESGGGTARDLTPGDYDSPPIDLGGSRDYDVSPDGKELVFARNTDPLIAISTNNDLFIVPLTGGEPRRITDNPANDSQPIYSPDGKYIAYRRMDRPGFEADRQQLMLYERSTGRHRNLTPQFDYSVGEVVWSPDGQTLYFNADDKGNESIFRIPVAGGTPTPILSTGSNTALRVTPDGKKLVFLRHRINQPAELFSMDVSGRNLKQLTFVNREILTRLDMPSLEDFWFEGAGGTRVHGLLLKPPAFDSSRTYPMIYLVHGGPQGQWSDEFHYRWNAQMFASRGYAVVMVNPRGSTGYGQRFTDEISGDWGGKVYDDLMKGLEYVIRSYSYIDGERVAAAGASYGGYMMNWMAGNTDRFTCIVSHDGVYNPYSMYGTTEELWFPEWEFGGTPYEKPELYEMWSPLRKASQFKTPMLVVHGQLDYRVDVSEGFQLFTALQRQGVKSKMLYFPDEGHFVTKPQNAELWWRTVLDWIDEHTKKN